MKLVVDTSIAVKWLLAEPYSRKARQLLGSRIVLHAPDFILTEVVNVIWKVTWRTCSIPNTSSISSTRATPWTTRLPSGGQSGAGMGLSHAGLRANSRSPLQSALLSLGIADAEDMDDVELDLLKRLHEDVFDSVETEHRLTVADIREWHRRWLGNVYVWAGSYRTLNMGKGGFQFAASGQVPRLMDNLDKEVLAVRTPCTGMSEHQLAEAIAVVHVELILIHPFREGNGRLSRLLASVMALQAGRRQLDYTPWNDRKTDYLAAIQAGMTNYGPMKGLVRRVLRETARNVDD